MSATTEALVEQIKVLETQIAAEASTSHRLPALNEQLRRLQKQLTTANEALTEGRQILKG